MIFPATTDKLQLITTTTSDLDIVVDFADVDNTTKAVTVGRQLTKITTATTTDILAAPASTATRKAKFININNVHASASNTVTVQYNANATLYKLETFTLAAGERASYVEGRGFRVFNTAGQEETDRVQPNEFKTGSVADQTTGAVDVYILGSDYPITGRIKIGSVIRWTLSMTKTAAGVAAPIWQIRLGTAGAIGDTSRASMTGVAQSGAIDQARIEVSATCRAIGASATFQIAMGGDHLLATTGFSVGGFANTVLSTAHDITAANTKIGISVNPGTAAAWTIKTVNIEAMNLLT